MKGRLFGKTAGFSIFELLALIVVNAQLVSVFVTASGSAREKAEATAMKNRGRAIWLAINVANGEREPLEMTALWPENLVSGEGKVIGESTREYFSYLLSDGERKDVISEDEYERVVADLDVASLGCRGLEPAEGNLKDENIAWSVCRVGDKTPSDVPFLFSKNMVARSIRGCSAEEASRLPLDASMVPFGGKLAVWVTRGGGVFDSRREHLTDYQVMGDVDESVDIWNCGK